MIGNLREKVVLVFALAKNVFVKGAIGELGGQALEA